MQSLVCPPLSPLQLLLLQLLLASIHTTEGHIYLTQTRVRSDSEPTWPVAGVASLELGASGILGYWFDCDSTEAVTRLTWERVGEARNPFEVSRLSSGSSRLIVGGGQLVEENLGQYRCWHRGTGESSVLLLTSESPAVVAEQSSVAAEIDQSLALSVHISVYLGPLSVNQLLITWHLPSGQALSSASDDRIQHHSTGSRLALTNITAADVGLYQVTVEQTRDGAVYTSSTTIELKPFIPATIVEHPSPVAVLRGRNASLTCAGTGSAPLVIKWKRAGAPSSSEVIEGPNVLLRQTTTDNKETVTVTSTLVLVQAGSEDAGSYYCEAHNQLNGLSHTVQSRQVNVSVTVDLAVPPSARVVYNNVSSTSHSVVLVSGGEARLALSCSANGHPPPSLSWDISPSLSVTPDDVPYTYVLTQSQLTLVWERPVEPSDSGLYDCVATNTWGQSTASVTLTVIHKPIIDSIVPAEQIKIITPKEKSSTATVEVPTNFMGTLLTCSGYAWPPPAIQWTSPSGDLPCGMTSHTRTQRGGVTTAELVLDAPFNSSCVGQVQCLVLQDQFMEVEVENVSYLVDLTQGGDFDPEHAAEFRLSVNTLHPVCSLWTEKQKSRMRTSFGRVLSRVVTSQPMERSQCITVSHLSCDGERVLFGGTVRNCPSSTGAQVQVTAFYSILSWKNRGPLVYLNGSLCRVDPEFPFCSPDSPCELNNSRERADSLTGINIGLYVVGGAVFVLVLLLLGVFIYKLRRASRKHPAGNLEKLSSDTKEDDPNRYTERLYPQVH